MADSAAQQTTISHLKAKAIKAAVKKKKKREWNSPKRKGQRKEVRLLFLGEIPSQIHEPWIQKS